MELNSKTLLFPALILTFGLGLFVGNKTTPAKVTEKSTATEKAKEVKKEEVKSIEESRVDKQEEKMVKKTKIQIEKPDGTKIQIEKEDSESKTQEVKEVVKYVEKEVVVEKEKIVEKKTEKIVESKKDWSVGLNLGLNSLTPTLQNYNVGIEVDRRILDDFWLGFRINKNLDRKFPTLGLGIRKEF